MTQSLATANENKPKQSSCGHRNKGKKNCLLSENLHSRQGSPTKCSHLHCQPLNDQGEEVDPGSTPFSHPGTLYAPEHPWVGPAFPPGAKSLAQAMTQHFYYIPPLHSINHRMAWVEKDLKDHLLSTPLPMGHIQPVDQATQSHNQPCLKCLHVWGIQNLFGQPVPVHHHPLSEKLPPIIYYCTGQYFGFFLTKLHPGILLTSLVLAPLVGLWLTLLLVNEQSMNQLLFLMSPENQRST